MKTTRISLPKDVAYMWSERMDWYVQDADAYAHTPEQTKLCEEMRQMPVTYYKTKTAFEVPYYGPDHAFTDLVRHSLELSIEDTYSLREEITGAHRSKLIKMLMNWVREGNFWMGPPKPRPKLAPEVEAFQKTVRAEVHEMVDHACNLLRKADSPVTVRAGFRDVLKTRISFHGNRQSSWGGVNDALNPFISLSLNELSVSQSEYTFSEYDHIAHSPAIGSCAGDWRVYLAVLIAHEMAHAVQHTARRNHTQIRSRKEMTRSLLLQGHGQGWQEIYRYLRLSWVNELPGYQSLEKDLI